jgi:hypothetical protein
MYRPVLITLNEKPLSLVRAQPRIVPHPLRPFLSELRLQIQFVHRMNETAARSSLTRYLLSVGFRHGVCISHAGERKGPGIPAVALRKR